MTDNQIKTILSQNVIIIYDGVCGLCNKSIQIILNNKPSHKLKFVSFQSHVGESILKYLKYNSGLESILVIENSNILKEATAFFKILEFVNPPLYFLSYLKILPLIITNFIYNFIAKKRYSLLKNRNKCRILTVEEKAFFLDLNS